MITIHKIAIRFLLFLIVFYCSTELYSQNTKANSEQSELLYKFVEQQYGEDQVLVNGKYFESIYVNDLGHPYFSDDAFERGDLVIHNQEYNGLLLKYNIVDQTILISHTGQFNTQTTFIPPNDFVSEFTIGGHLFKKYKFHNEDERFFEEVYLGEISCLCYWKKNRDESKHNISFMAHKFSESHKKIYAVIDGSPYSLKNKKALTKLFPEHKKSITQFMKEYNIKLYKSSNKKLGELMAFCETLANRQ